MARKRDPDRFWRTADGAYHLQVTAAAKTRLDRICDDAASKETGGILIGYYTADYTTAVLTEVTPPPSDSRSGPTWFVRGLAGLRELLGRRWRSRERRHYIGEWHYHPANLVEPSADDFAQMVSIAAAPEYRCKEPILLIAGRAPSADSTERPVRAFVCLADGLHSELVPAKESPASATAAVGAPAAPPYGTSGHA